MFIYTSQLRADVEAALSADRLNAYRNAVAGDLERAIELYVWNAAAAAAFFGPIGVLEVSLRNAFDRELTHAFTKPWYDDVEHHSRVRASIADGPCPPGFKF